MAMTPVLPKWDAGEETADDAHVMTRYKVYPCAAYREGDCCARSCFDYHSDGEMRRPVVDGQMQLLYWDAMCSFVEKGQPCPYGYGCQFAHTPEEREFHPGQFNLQNRPHAAEFSLRLNMHDGAIPQTEEEACAGSNSVYKRRFCAHYPKVDNCRRKEFCMFAHSREEIRAPLLTEGEESKSDLSNAFFINKFKIFWCPIGVQHDWQTCVYAHNYQDARRNPGIGYGPRPCPFWEKKDRAPSYEARCPNGFRCPYSHGAKEQLYHPRYFKTVVCWDFDQNCHGCPRDNLCAFYHRKKTQRQAGKDSTNYSKPLAAPSMRKLQPFFRSPPFFADEPEMRGTGRRNKRDSQHVRQVNMSPMMMVDCQMPYEMSPCGSPSNSMNGCSPMMMMGDPQQMPMMMYMPNNQCNNYMVCDSPTMYPQGSPHKGKFGAIDDAARSPTEQSTQPGSPLSGSMASPTHGTPFGSPLHQQDSNGMPFGGLFTMPVDKMGDGAMMPGMMMVPMFIDPTHQFEPPMRFDQGYGDVNSNQKQGGSFKITDHNVSLTSMATNSGSDPSLESSGSDADSDAHGRQAFQSQYLWTEAGTEEPVAVPSVTA